MSLYVLIPYRQFVHLVFEDVEGHAGRVTEELVVEYDGRWSAEIERYVAFVSESHRAGGTGAEAPTDDVFDELVVEMPERVPVSAVERRD